MCEACRSKNGRLFPLVPALNQIHSTPGVYGEFDAEGIPTKLANSEELSAKKRKDLVKDSAFQLSEASIVLSLIANANPAHAFATDFQEMAKQHKDFEKLQKQAGDAGIAPWQQLKPWQLKPWQLKPWQLEAALEC